MSEFVEITYAPPLKVGDRVVSLNDDGGRMVFEGIVREVRVEYPFVETDGAIDFSLPEVSVEVDWLPAKSTEWEMEYGWGIGRVNDDGSWSTLPEREYGGNE